MIVKRGSIVSHKVAQEWGIGKVTEVNESRATIRFNDGMIRKITASHFRNLQPADPAGYLPKVDKLPISNLRPAKAASKGTRRKPADKATA
jgi:hypothetical protein